MDYGVVLVAVVLALAAGVAGAVVVLRGRLPAEILVEAEAVAQAIRATLGELATEERVRWMAGYVYDLADGALPSRVSREEFEGLVWQAVRRTLALEEATMGAATMLAGSPLAKGGGS